MKKVLLTLFFLAALSILFQGNSQAANNAQIIFSSNDNVVKGQNVTVEVYVESNTEVNAAQVKILYPEAEFSLVSVNSESSDFSIQAEESLESGSATIARGNIQPLKGKKLLTTLILNPKTSGATISNLGYDQFDSLVMSKDNVNILTGSKVLTVKPVTPAPPITEKKSGFFAIFKQAVQEFFRSIFGR